MDVLTSPVLQSSNLFCRLSSGAPNSTHSTLFKRNLPRNGPGHYFHLSTSTSWRRPSTRGGGTGVLQVSANFRAPSRRRRNSLRDKLLPPLREDQVRTLPELPSLDSNLECSNLVDDEVKVSLDSEKEVVDDVSSGKSDSSAKNPVLWDKLENWVDQYKADSEFWGIGANPIFRLFQDSQGKVVRVSVDEDEIAKRSRIPAWSPEEKEGVGESMDVKAKVSRAKLIARMIESGEYALPKNSSVVKYLVEEKKPSFSQGIRSVSLYVMPFVKTFPRAGIMLVCGCCIFWAMMNFFVQNEKVELSREEAEMLRRKVKLRMEREEFEKGKIKVLGSEPEPELAMCNKPQLDRDELMKDIMQAKEASRKNLVITGSSSQLDARNHGFDDKVREIREMARKAREMEQKDSSETESSDIREDAISSILLAAGSPSGNKNSAISDTKPIKKESYPAFESNLLTVQENNIKVHSDVNNKKVLGQDVTQNVDDVSCGEPQNKCQKDGNNLNVKVNGAPHICIDARNRVNCSETTTPMEDGLPNGEEVEGNEMKSSVTVDRVSSSGASSGNLFRSKPRVITSVEEAKEYLARKRSILKDRVQTYKEVNAKELPAEVNAASCAVGKKANESVSLGGEIADDVKTLYNLEDANDQMLAPELYGNNFEACVSKLRDVEDLSIGKPNGDFANVSELPSAVEDIEVPGEDSFSSNFENANGALNFSHSKAAKGINSDESLFRGSAENADIDAVSLQAKFLNVKQINVPDKRDAQLFDNIDNITKVDSLNSYEVCKPTMPSPLKNDNVCCSQGVNNIENERELNEKIEAQEAAIEFHMTNNKSSFINEVAVIAGSVTEASLKLEQRQEVDSSTSLSSLDSITVKQNTDNDPCQSYSVGVSIPGDSKSQQFVCAALGNSDQEHDVKSLLNPELNCSHDSNVVDFLKEEKQLTHEKGWLEENFQELDPVIKKIGVGFRENYMVAKEKVQEHSVLDADIDLRLTQGNDLEWMNDDSLRKIVFQVRENELAGRDPFHSMSAADKSAFFKGLESLAEKENEKLVNLHEWVHSRIENLDYGSEGISLYDPVEKVIPRWKGPSINKDTDFLLHHKPLFSEEEVNESTLQKMKESPNSVDMFSGEPSNNVKKSIVGASAEKTKTLIECSDGTIRPGKKKGKEHWQHTKKWSQDFLEVYNAETDPEIKSVLRDMGKDLDRWITEKEMQDAADLMTKIPKRKRRYIEKKMERIKREVQMFGAPAVVSKYKEYADEKGEDYLWWLDLPYVLCIELYTSKEGTPSVGFYSLEMAADLELSPKQYHVIAFEDPGDSKNFCYIIQAHMDMLGSGKAFVIARPPKDAFREAKANGFSVTVIKKGELKVNVDQTLEEVEEEITEIGSKVYHDKIMRERSVDINTLMKGVITADRSTKRGSKKMLARPPKS